MLISQQKHCSLGIPTSLYRAFAAATRALIFALDIVVVLFPILDHDHILQPGLLIDTIAKDDVVPLTPPDNGVFVLVNPLILSALDLHVCLLDSTQRFRGHSGGTLLHVTFLQRRKRGHLTLRPRGFSTLKHCFL
jgi:hypothetical protein